jgi:hypothetical protein
MIDRTETRMCRSLQAGINRMPSRGNGIDRAPLPSEGKRILYGDYKQSGRQYAVFHPTLKQHHSNLSIF